MQVGILALQGGFEAHTKAIEAIGHTATRVRYAEQLDEMDGLILPGGESSTHLRILEREEIDGPLDTFVRSGRPVLATCAGLILAASEVTHPVQRCFGWLDVTVSRNGWGRQLDSFEAVDDSRETPLVFIRAPRITSVTGSTRVLMTYQDEPVMVQNGAVFGATFHPELAADRRIHASIFGGCRG